MHQQEQGGVVTVAAAVRLAQIVLVVGMEKACDLIDRIRPWRLVAYTPLRWLGCPSGLARWSCALDERWDTGVWQALAGDDDEEIYA